MRFDEAQATAKADAQGRWQVTLAALKADGKPHHMTISGKNKIEIDDILIGEVWVGSGQSNMEQSVAGSTDPKKTIAAADHPTIRLYHVPKVQTPKPTKSESVSASLMNAPHGFNGGAGVPTLSEGFGFSEMKKTSPCLSSASRPCDRRDDRAEKV